VIKKCTAWHALCRLGQQKRRSGQENKFSCPDNNAREINGLALRNTPYGQEDSKTSRYGCKTKTRLVATNHFHYRFLAPTSNGAFSCPPVLNTRSARAWLPMRVAGCVLSVGLAPGTHLAEARTTRPKNGTTPLAERGAGGIRPCGSVPPFRGTARRVPRGTEPYWPRHGSRPSPARRAVPTRLPRGPRTRR
jgi:hypothetical protein